MLDCSDFKNEVEKIQSNIDLDDLYEEEDGYGIETEPHITILYGIHEQDSNIVKDIVDLYPVEYKIDGLSSFENENFDVLKCTIISKDLNKLNKSSRKILDYSNDYPEYTPHLTLAYLKPGTGKKYIKIKSNLFKGYKKSNKFIFSNKDSKKVYWMVD